MELKNSKKTIIMELDKWQDNTHIVMDNIHIERVQSFQYLGAMFTTIGDGASNIKPRLAIAKVHKLDIKRITVFERKYNSNILRVLWIAHRTNSSMSNELHLPTNWLYSILLVVLFSVQLIHNILL